MKMPCHRQGGSRASGILIIFLTGVVLVTPFFIPRYEKYSSIMFDLSGVYPVWVEP
jgi:hypothetical protein